MDKFKKYLEDNRSSLDADTPPVFIWEAIQKKTTGAKAAARIYHLKKYAAVAAFMLVVGGGTWVLTKKEKKQNEVVYTEKSLPITEKPGMNEKLPDTTKNIQVKELVLVQPKQIPPTKNNKPIKPSISVDDLAVANKSYQRLVSYQLERLRSTPVFAESPDYFNAFFLQMNQMDKDEQTVKNDINIYGLNDGLLEQLFTVYQHKLNLLKSLQKEITKMNKTVKQHNTERRQAYYLNL